MRGLAARGWARLLVIGVGIGFGSGCQKAGDGGSTQGTATNGGSTLAPPQEWENPCAPLANGTIVSSPRSGTFDETVTVELRAAGPAGEIRYTLDRTPPTLDSPLYEASLTLSETTEIRAQVFVDGEAHGTKNQPIGFTFC